MSDSRRDRIEALYHEALKLDARRREAFLDDACGGDAELLSEVRSLLGYASEAKGLLERPLAEVVTKSVALWSGVQVDGYEITGMLGAGGMGEVYRARDLKLGREVAIKVLPSALADDPARRRRFEREARVAASLNHPNIATVHGIGEHEGAPFIAMELVEGQTLKERLDAGPLSRIELLRFASQIASGLARAHRAGILHRDLKPGNLMVTPDGLVKLLDFGLAKQVSEVASRSSELTGEGAMVGTVHYMSPEQAKGRPLDERSDQFSLGSVLYEMATGKRAFSRETVSETLAAILEHEPRPVGALAPHLPEDFAAIVARCLSKDPAGRYTSTAELAEALERVAADASSGGKAAAPGAGRRRPWVVGGLLAAAVVIAAIVMRPRPPDPAPVTRTPVRPVPLTSYPGLEADPTFSPDGSQVAFSWGGEDGDNPDVYVKAVGSEQALRLTTDPAPDGSPAWSPDGRTIAFLRERDGGGSEVRLVPPTGGSERWLADVAAGADGGLAWSPDGERLAVSDRSGAEANAGLVQLDVARGSREALVSPPRGSVETYQRPAYSPDGRNVAFVAERQGRLLVVGVAGGEPRDLGPAAGGRPAWQPDGETLVFGAVGREQDGGWLPSTGFIYDAQLWLLPLRGGAAQLVPGTTGAYSVAVSGLSRRLAYQEQRLGGDVWRLDLDAEAPGAGAAATRLIASTALDTNPQFSPDGERVVFTSARTGHGEIWVADREGRSLLQLTSFGERRSSGSPRWAPDGRSVVFDVAEGDGDINVYVVGSSGGTPRQITTHPARDTNPSWSRDGAWIYCASERSGEEQIWKVPATGDEAEAVQVTRQGGYIPRESVDGQYVYYGKSVDDASLWRVPVDGGEEEVAVASLPSPKVWDITVDGIYYYDVADEPGAPWTIQFLAFGSEAPVRRAVLGYEPSLAYGFSVSRDGRWALSTESRRESDLMLVEDFR